MLRILRWTVLGLLLVVFVAPAVQAQTGGIGVVTAASGADSDPNGAPSPSTVALDWRAENPIRGPRGEVREAAARGERPFAHEEEASFGVELVVQALLRLFPF